MTLQDVAKKANVSVSTVSRALNDSGVVNESTRRRVLRVAEQLDYRPNRYAQFLANGRTRSLGMVVSNISNPFFLDIFVSMEEVARRKRYEVLVEHTGYSAARLISGIHSMLERRVAGLAVIVSEMAQTVMEEILASGLPTVVYDVGSPGPKITNIRTRYKLGMQRIVQYLYGLGHRRMAFVAHHSGLTPLGARRQSFVEAAAEYGKSVDFDVVTGDEDSPAGGMEAVRRLLSSGFQPTAIVCVNDCMAIGAMRAVLSSGLSIPQDISVTGFDNITFSQFTNPPLTTVDIPRGRIGQMAAEALLSHGNHLAGQEVLVEPELVVRDSTGPT